MSENNNEYVVLARKYRPQTFDDLLGQDALVQTLSNAITSNRLHHAYILTGIRGVGKTTTARIVAKALNCTGVDGKSGPTIKPCGVCENCMAITADRHMDVLEFDAASKTGVDDMREILDGVKYKPTLGRYKIYIIDEVHMLSKSAFNALLKTLEEPPAHVKFIFATTEVRKIPPTVLSRCQRFDLQRLTISDLLFLFNKILGKEGLKAEEEALKLIAKMADGSARDSLSMLDQAIALSHGDIKTNIVQEMIGLGDRTISFDLFESLINGDMNKVLEILNNQLKNGGNPIVTLQDLVATTHLITKVKVAPIFGKDISLSQAEKNFITKVEKKTTVAILSKIWQMLLKGIAELSYAPNQADALEMILIRIAYSANLPTPQQLMEEIKKKPVIEIGTQSNEIPTFSTTSAEKKTIDSTESLIKALDDAKKMRISYAVKNDLEIKKIENCKIEMNITFKIDNPFIFELRSFLEKTTGKDWEINTTRAEYVTSIASIKNQEKQKEIDDIKKDPLIKAILQEFAGASIESITRKAIEQISNNILEPEFIEDVE
ncbi:MAG: DNA polymerase III subunit gamma/tau [Alphaproteobacteria bacterium]